MDVVAIIRSWQCLNVLLHLKSACKSLHAKANGNFSGLYKKICQVLPEFHSANL